jgi:glyoxalase family protein
MILGLHHVTAIGGDPQENFNFYSGFLGMRLVKRTVNFDDPGTYHLYNGDAHGSPGSLVTFFAWPNSYRGRAGTGQPTTISLVVPKGSLGAWIHRANDAGVSMSERMTRFEEEYVTLEDPDGIEVELVASGSDNEAPAVERLHSVTLSEEGYERTAAMLTGLLGYRLRAETGNRFRYEIAGGGPSTYLDVVCAPDLRRGGMGSGTIHHVAVRTPDDAAQAEWRKKVVAAGLNVSPVMDRQYFRSIYFREPGGVLFEIATDPPGFATDEDLAHLGEALKLPPWLEPVRGQIERRLPALETA